MAIDFRKIASKELSLSPLMVNRDQIQTSALLGQTVTVTNFDFAHITYKGEEKVFPVLLFAEHPDKYYNGGCLLSRICEAWAAEFDGDVEAASIALEETGGVRIKFSATKTKSSNNLTSITVL